MSNLNQDNTQTRKVVPAILMAAGAVGLIGLAAHSMFNGPADALSASPDFLAETAMLQSEVSDEPTNEVAAIAAPIDIPADTTDETAIGAPRFVRDAVATAIAAPTPVAEAETFEEIVDPYEVVEADGFEKPIDQIELSTVSLTDIVADAEPLAEPVPTPVVIETPAPIKVAEATEEIEPAPLADIDGATDSFVREGLSERGDVRMPVAGSQVITTNRPFTRVSVGSPDIAEVNPLGVDSLLVTAKATGHTQLILWDEDDQSEMIQLAVEPDFAALRDAMLVAFPNEDISITPVGNTIALQGRVSDIDTAEQILEVASTFADEVVNLLEIGGGQTVMLRVRFAEVSRDMSRELGINFGFQDGPTIFGSNIGAIAPIGQAGGSIITPLGSSPGVQAFATGSIDGDPFFGFVNALKEANLLRMLSEPNVTVMSGQKGTMLAGGEIPVPVPQEETITIEYKEFGVRLDYVPTVLGDGRIRLKLDTRSSDLDFARAVTIAGLQIPALNTKENSTTVELAPGQTLMIGGLLESRVTANRSSVPGLGELPIVGALFRSVRYERAETELVVMVTPTLVEGMNPDVTPEVPGDRWRHPDDLELFGFGEFGEDISNKPEPAPVVEPVVDGEVSDTETVLANEGEAEPDVTEVIAVKEDEDVMVEDQAVETDTVPAAEDAKLEAPAEVEEAIEQSTEAIDDQPRRETAAPMVIEPATAKDAAEPTPFSATTQRELPTGPRFIGFIGFSEK
ncbi:MAG: pilus assembly protein N-terminal domain-containing protein [Planctomycetota bacterium]